MPVTGFVAAAREARRAARGRDVCSRFLAVNWIQQLKSLASTRDARSHATPTASRNRHHRSRSTDYDRSVDSDFPDASRSRRKTDTGPTTSAPGPTTRYGSRTSPVSTRRPAPRRGLGHLPQIQDLLARRQPVPRRCQQQRKLGIGVRRPHVLNPLDLASPARHDLNRYRSRSSADLAHEPRDHPSRLARRGY